MKTETDSINFFRKIYFSVCKFKQYGNLSKQGVKKSAFYITDIILICSIIYASILTLQIRKNANGLKEYLEQNLPNLTYQEGILVSEVDQRVVLDNELIKINFGGQFIIDTKTDYEKLIDEYKKTTQPSILLTSNKYVTINSQGFVSEYNYSEFINQKGEQITIGKDYFVNIFSNISYGYYFFVYLLGSAIGTSIIIFIYNLLISGVAFIWCKVKRIKAKFGEIYSMGLYAHTISVLGYFIVNFLPSSVGVYVQLLSLIIPIGYLAYAVYLNKWVMPE